MINRRTALILLAAAAAAATPGAFSEGSTTGPNGWKFTWAAVVKPALASGQHLKIQTDASHSDASGQPTVFHRFFTDSANHTYFGYDLMVEQPVGQTTAVIRFLPLSLRTDQIPRRYATADFKAVGLPRFPTQTFKSGETIAVDVLANPTNGQKVVDYIQVTYAPEGPAEPRTVAAAIERPKTIGNPAAPVRIEVFSDFECPACKNFHETVLPLLIREYISTGKAFLVSREFPLPMHPHSRDAAVLATAAGVMGKYQLVGDTLFQNQSTWASTGDIWAVLAPVLSPSEEKHLREIAAQPYVAGVVQQDVDRALNQRVNSTPTLMISRGDRSYPFAGPTLANYPLLRSLLDELLK